MQFCSESTGGNVLFISRYSYIRPLSMTRMQFWPIHLFFGSFEVIWGQIRFLHLTFDRIEIERWGMAPMRLSCTDASTDMPYELLGSTRDLIWPWPEVKFWNWPLRSKCTHFDASWRKEHDAAKIISPAFLFQVICKKLFCKKALFWPSLTSAA